MLNNVSVELKEGLLKRSEIMCHGNMKFRVLYSPRDILKLPYCDGETYSTEVLKTTKLVKSAKAEKRVLFSYYPCYLCYFDDDCGKEYSTLVAYVESVTLGDVI